jgi:hypothetical protein
MSSLIQFAADFIERMSNPVYGLQVNDEAALEFAAIFDDAVSERFRFEASQLQTPDALTSYGWTWLLDWAASEGVRLDSELLINLCETRESASFKAAVISAATIDDSYEPQDSPDLEGFPNPWLRQLLSRAVEPPPTDDRTGEHQRPSRHAESLLIALILIERGSTLDAASALLHHRWDQGESLVRFFWHRMELLDEDTRQAWERRLRPPPPGLFEE